MTAPETIPRPLATDGVAFVDVASRTVTVRLSELASGYQRMLWTSGWRMLRQAREAGWPPGGPSFVYASIPGADRVVHGEPVEGGALSFTFPVGTAGFAGLVGRPGLAAILTVDRGTHHILGVRFVNRAGRTSS